MKTFFLVILLFLCAIAYTQEPGAGNTLRFDGNSTRIIHEPLFNNAELPITLSYWLKINGTPRSVERIFNSCYTPDNIYYGFSSNYSTGGVNINIGDGRGPLNPSFRRGKKYNFSNDISDRWIHVAISIRGSRDMSIYINGIDAGGSYSGSGLAMAVNSACETIIGYGTDNNGTQFLRGELDEIRVWDYSRSIDQIRLNMTRKLNGDESGLIGYWKFDEGSGSDIEELISGNQGNIEGDVNWVLSGAPIGNESFFEYFPSGTKRKLFKNEQDSFWISTESNNWVGYQVYKVNEHPNSAEGSTMDLSNGYYGVYPIFEDEESGEYRIDFGSSECAKGDFRNGNSDVTWEEVVDKSDSSLYLVGNEIIEFVFESNGSSNPIEDVYFVCADESVIIDASSDCTTSYNWFNSSSNSVIEIFDPGEYWIERTTPIGVFRHDFTVEVLTTESDFLSKDFYFICENEFPLTLNAQINQEFTWSTGEIGESISVDSRGIYWAEYLSDCGFIRDSVFVEVIEFESNFFIEDSLFICENEFPFLIESTLNQDLIWSNGVEAESIQVDSIGFYWAEYQSECGVVRDSVYLDVIDITSDFLSEDFYSICENEFPLTLNTQIKKEYTWSTGETGESINVSAGGIYWAEYMSICGIVRDTTIVRIPTFESDFFSEKSLTVCQSDLPIFLRPTLSRNLSWSTGEVDSLISIDASGTYWAEYESGCGVIRDSVFVEILELNDVFIPNVITPNNDHLNDCFVVDDQLEGSELLVFNRAGVEVYRSTSYQNNWCPENIGSGVYFYQFSSTCYLESFKGWISVLK